MQAGDHIRIRALKACGNCYRWWPAFVESVEGGRIITMSRVGHAVRGPKGGWISKFDTRGVYWLDRPYNLIELYLPDGTLKQVYIHIASPARIEADEIIYTDHELDIVRRPGERIRVVDQGEFEVACSEYGYTPQFQSACKQAVSEAMHLAATWLPVGPPPCRRRARRRQRVRTSTPAIDSSTRSSEV
jgi:protein associated with RNAse G/E